VLKKFVARRMLIPAEAHLDSRHRVIEIVAGDETATENSDVNQVRHWKHSGPVSDNFEEPYLK
jgi:hypothetical protein